MPLRRKSVTMHRLTHPIRQRAMIRRFVLFVFALAAVATVGRAAEPGSSSSTHAVGNALPSTQLHNLFRVTTNILSGSSPYRDAAFAEIARLGVKTIISVDGTRPDVETARNHGLRYIHLPFGYAGVPTNRVAELVKAARTASGPIYVHCHHGLHRGPAAVAVI